MRSVSVSSASATRSCHSSLPLLAGRAQPLLTPSTSRVGLRIGSPSSLSPLSESSDAIVSPSASLSLSQRTSETLSRACLWTSKATTTPSPVSCGTTRPTTAATRGAKSTATPRIATTGMLHRVRPRLDMTSKLLVTGPSASSQSRVAGRVSTITATSATTLATVSPSASFPWTQRRPRIAVPKPHRCRSASTPQYLGATRSARSSNAAQSRSSSDNPTATVSASRRSAGPRWMSSTGTRATGAESRQGRRDARRVVTGTRIVRPSSTTPPINKTAVAPPAASITSPTSGSMRPSSTAPSSMTKSTSTPGMTTAEGTRKSPQRQRPSSVHRGTETSIVGMMTTSAATRPSQSVARTSSCSRSRTTTRSPTTTGTTAATDTVRADSLGTQTKRTTARVGGGRSRTTMSAIADTHYQRTIVTSREGPASRIAGRTAPRRTTATTATSPTRTAPAARRDRLAPLPPPPIAPQQETLRRRSPSECISRSSILR